LLIAVSATFIEEQTWGVGEQRKKKGMMWGRNLGGKIFQPRKRYREEKELGFVVGIGKKKSYI